MLLKLLLLKLLLPKLLLLLLLLLGEEPLLLGRPGVEGRPLQRYVGLGASQELVQGRPVLPVGLLDLAGEELPDGGGKSRLIYGR